MMSFLLPVLTVASCASCLAAVTNIFAFVVDFFASFHSFKLILYGSAALDLILKRSAHMTWRIKIDAKNGWKGKNT